MKKGFSLIELLVVVAIIGILAGAGLVSYNGYTERGKIIALNANCDLAKKHIITQLARCEVGNLIQNWTSGATINPHDTNCDTTTNKFVQNFGYAMGVLAHDPKYKNPLNSSDRAFVTDWDPPLAKNIGRVNCGINGSLNTNPIICYCRWGSGEDEYDTVLVQNP